MSEQIYSELIREIGEISQKITNLVNELRPVTEKIRVGKYDSEMLEKNNRIQEEIGRLD